MDEALGWLQNSVVADVQADPPDAQGTMVHARIIRGVAHPPGEPESYNGLKFTQSEINSKYLELAGTIVYDNHDLGRPIGKVMASSVGDDGSLRLDVLLDTQKYEHASEVMERVLSGDYRGMSLGCRHEYNPTTGHVHASHVTELSLCPQGDLPHTDIYTIATKDPGGGLDRPFAVRWLDLHPATSVETAAAAAEEAAGESPRPASAPAAAAAVAEPTSTDAGGAPAPAAASLDGRFDEARYLSGANGGEAAPNAHTGTAGTTGTTGTSERAMSDSTQHTTTPAPASAPGAAAPASAAASAADAGTSRRPSPFCVRAPTETDPYCRTADGRFASTDWMLTPPRAPPSTTTGNAAGLTASISNRVTGGGAGASAPEAAPRTGAPGATPAEPPAASTGAGAAPEAAATPPAAGDGSESAVPRKAVIDQTEYDAFLEMKARFEEQQKQQAEMAKQLEEQKSALKEWEGIGASLGTSNQEEAAAALEGLKKREIAKFMEKLKEIWPDMKRRYDEATPASRKWMDKYVKPLQSYMVDQDLLKEPGKLDDAHGLVELMTQASRESNTRFSQQEAKIKELQRKYEEAEREREAAKRKAEEELRRADLRAQSGTSRPGAQTIAPTMVPAAGQGASAPVPSAPPSTATHAAAHKSYGATPVPPFMRHLAPPAPEPGTASLTSTASATGGPVDEAYDVAHGPHAGVKRVRVRVPGGPHAGINRVRVRDDKGEEHEIEYAPWDTRKGIYSQMGDQLPANQTWAWLGDGIQRGSFLLPGLSSGDLSAGRKYDGTSDFQLGPPASSGYAPW